MKPLPAFRGIVFDLDGTLVNSEPVHFAAWIQILGGFGIVYSDHWFEQWIGRPDRLLAEWVIETHRIQEPIDDFLQRKRRIFREIGAAEIRAFPMVRDGIRDLKERYPLAVATSSTAEDATLSLQVTGLREHLRAVVTADDVAHLKPAPDAYLLASLHLQLSPAQCIAIEDSVAGVAAAKTAGFYTLAVTTSNPPEKLQEADQIIPDIATFFSFVLNGG